MRTYTIPTSQISAGKQDRTTFEPAALQALATDMGKNGLLQPIMVRKLGEGEYKIILGERRFRAATQLLNWKEIPCIVRDVTDEEASAGQLAENMNRKNLDAIDEANAYQDRISQFDWSVEYIAQVAGVSTVRVLFRLKLLKLRSDLQALIRSENLQLGYAQILADAELDTNFQAIAVDRLRANASPTPAWFRREVGTLVTTQYQVDQFSSIEDMALFAQPSGTPAQMPSIFGASPAQQLADQIPMTGLESPAPAGSTPAEVMAHQIAGWRAAAKAWDRLGKNFKKGECESAANALESALAMF